MPSMSDYIDQIIRDSKVLAGDPIFHQPSREFYEDRVAACMSELHKMGQQQLSVPMSWRNVDETIPDISESLAQKSQEEKA